MRSVLVVSHGSRNPKTKEEVMGLVESLRQRLPGTIVELAFLEIESPSIPQGMDICVQQGALDVTIALNFLNAGRHVNDDIPALVQAAQNKYPKTNFSITRPIGQHAQIPNLFIDLINEVRQ